jgi:hypothetical protein
MELYFDIPVDLEHAMTVAERIERILHEESTPPHLALSAVRALQAALGRAEENDLDDSVRLARALVLEIRSGGIQSDRLGQRIRNLFELLGLGKEGASQGLVCGESAYSLMRP